MPSAKIVFINFYNKQTLPNQVVVLKAGEGDDRGRDGWMALPT